MSARSRFFLKIFILMGGCLLPSHFIFGNAWADTVTLKDSKELKGLVVEKHFDRIFLSTEQGEIQILLSGIKDIEYSDPEQSLFVIGKRYELEDKFGEALAFYQKALEVNPDFLEAKQAADGVRSRFWAQSLEGPVRQMQEKQAMYEAWQKGSATQEMASEEKSTQVKNLLKETFGINLKDEGDWARVSFADSKKTAHESGIRAGDFLVSFNGESLRYLGSDVVGSKFLSSNFLNFNIDVERDLTLNKKPKARLKDMGFKLKLEFSGLTIQDLKESSDAYQTGLRQGDLLVQINNNSTRYLPMKKVLKIIEDSKEDTILFKVRRSFLVTRR